MSDLHKRLMQSGLGGLPPRGARPGGGGPRRRDYSPLHWNSYFERHRQVEMDNGDSFCVYEKDSRDEEKGPVVMLLHGGGFSALTW